jgi:hypothetical protein
MWWREGKALDNEDDALMTSHCDEWTEIRRLATHGRADELLAIGCPNCGAAIRVSFVSGRRNALNIECLHCYQGIRADGLDSVPSWVGQYNGSFFTNPATAER